MYNGKPHHPLKQKQSIMFVHILARIFTKKQLQVLLNVAGRRRSRFLASQHSVRDATGHGQQLPLSVYTIVFIKKIISAKQIYILASVCFCPVVPSRACGGKASAAGPSCNVRGKRRAAQSYSGLGDGLRRVSIVPAIQDPQVYVLR